MKEKQLIENLYERKDTKERAIRIWLLKNMAINAYRKKYLHVERSG
jgi:hypothetical protein